MNGLPLQFPVTKLEHVVLACQPNDPLEPGDKRYVDFAALRHGQGLGGLRSDLLDPLPTGKFHHRCICGHRGCGKTTELLALKDWADQNGFAVVHMEVDEHYGQIELDFSDLFLLAATGAERAAEDLGSRLPDRQVRGVVEWFSERIDEVRDTAQSELSVEAGGQVGGSLPLGLGKLFAKFTAGVKAGTQHATTVRTQIRSYPNALIDLTNQLLETANALLTEAGRPHGLLLLFDNLDRYEPDCIDRALFRNSHLVQHLGCHALFTVPIALEYEPRGTIQDAHGVLLVLPMLPLRRQPSSWAETVAGSTFEQEAVAGLREALAARVDLDRLFEHPDDADLLVRMSGGCIRDLMHLVTLARHEVGGAAVITTEAVVKAIRRMRASYITRLAQEDYDRLAAIAHRDRVPRDALTRRLLFQRFALEYWDADYVPWIDVHPLVVETEEFRSAYGHDSSIATG